MNHSLEAYLQRCSTDDLTNYRNYLLHQPSSQWNAYLMQILLWELKQRNQETS